MGSVSMLYSDPGQTFGSTSQLFSGYAVSLSGRVFGEQRGGAAEILPRIGVEHENHPQLHILSSGIRTYLNLLEIIDIV